MGSAYVNSENFKLRRGGFHNCWVAKVTCILLKCNNLYVNKS